jgi:hypothetical protein
VVTAIGGAWASHIASDTQRQISARDSKAQAKISQRELDNQKEISRREIRAAQVRELAALTASLESSRDTPAAAEGASGAPGGSRPTAVSSSATPDSERPRYSVFVARLAGYGATAAPVLTEMLSWELNKDDRRAVERGLVYLGFQEGGREAIGRMLEYVLQQEKLYLPPTHLSALRVLTILSYDGARDTLAAYRPEDRVLHWNSVESDKDQKPAFCEILNKARQAVGASGRAFGACPWPSPGPEDEPNDPAVPAK